METPLESQICFNLLLGFYLVVIVFSVTVNDCIEKYENECMKKLYTSAQFFGAEVDSSISSSG